MARAINLIVVHCSATADGDGLYRGPRGARASKTPASIIDGWHAERGFKRSHPNAQHWNPELQHIGYHFVISCDGSFLTGRSDEEPGAHAQGYNANSLGVCLTGTDKFTPAQFSRLAELLTWLGKQHRIPLRYPNRVGGVLRDGVCGHRDLSPDQNGSGRAEPFEWLKTCPGFDVEGFLSRGLKPLPEDLYTGVLK